MEPPNALLRYTLTSRSVSHKPVTVIGLAVKVWPSEGSEIVAEDVGGGLGITPCIPIPWSLGFLGGVKACADSRGNIIIEISASEKTTSARRQWFIHNHNTVSSINNQGYRLRRLPPALKSRILKTTKVIKPATSPSTPRTTAKNHHGRYQKLVAAVISRVSPPNCP